MYVTLTLVLVLQLTYCATLISEPVSLMINKIIELGEVFTNGYFVNVVGMDIYDYNVIFSLLVLSFLGSSPALELLMYSNYFIIRQVDL